MYTQCPKCQTVFRVTLEQLQARAGIVRCGQCSLVFQADDHLYTEMPLETPKKNEKPKSGSGAKKARRGGKSAAPVQAKAPAVPTIHTLPRREKRSAKHRSGADRPLLVASLLAERPTRRPPSFLWIFASGLLAVVLVAQAGYFHRDALAHYAPLRPFLVEICAQLECAIRPSFDLGRIELIQPTGMAPHPRIRNALRLRATVVNRAQKSQPFPLMEVTLTDSTGGTLARRTFMPREYLEPPALEAEMAPNLAVNISLDVTNPDGKAAGYQIDFVAPPPR